MADKYQNDIPKKSDEFMKAIFGENTRKFEKKIYNYRKLFNIEEWIKANESIINEQDKRRRAGQAQKR